MLPFFDHPPVFLLCILSIKIHQTISFFYIPLILTNITTYVYLFVLIKIGSIISVVGKTIIEITEPILL